MWATTPQSLRATWSGRSVSTDDSLIWIQVDGVNIDNWTFEALVD
jgi:hypothetical protein